jgi:hypothetical protein
MEMTLIICVCVGLVKGFFIGAGWCSNRMEKEINKLKDERDKLEKEGHHKDYLIAKYFK